MAPQRFLLKHASGLLRSWMMNRNETVTDGHVAKAALGSRPIILIENAGEVPRLAAQRRLNSVIVPANDMCLQAVAQAVVSSPRKAGVLVIPWLPRAEIFPVILRGFYRVFPLAITAFPNDPQRLCSVLTAAEPARIIGAVPDATLAVITLFRADLSMLCVPSSWFIPEEDRDMADINALQLRDDGTMIHLGSRHWSAHAISSAFDAAFRRSVRRQELMQSDSLGGLIRRLRKERRLAREEFPGIDAKTIARIERNEITRPQRETLRLIALTLGLPIEQLLAAMAVPPTDAPPQQQQADEHSASA